MKTALVAVALVIGTAGLGAQQPLTLTDAQAEARAHAPEAGQLEAAVRGAEAVASQAHRRFRDNPTVAGTYFNGALTGRADESSWSLGTTLPVDVSGSWRPRAASAEADVARARFDQADGLRALDEQVAIAVADVALQQRLVARTERVASVLVIAADAAHRKLDVGQGTQLDADSADLDLAAARATVETTTGELAKARARLARFLGRADADGLVVADPEEPLAPRQRPDIAALVERDPRVQSARAELEAAQLERQTYERMAVPMPTFGVEVGSNRRDVPAGAFSGSPLVDGVTAHWLDRDLVFSINAPLPIFDRQQQPRAQATAREMAAETGLTLVRATVRSELESTWATLEAAQGAAAAVAGMPRLIDRDVSFVDQAVRAGAFDAVTRTQELRRLVDAGRAADVAVRDYRAALAAWNRRSMK